MEFEYLKDEKIKCYPANNTEKRGIRSYLTRYVDGFRFDPLFKLKLWDGKNSKYNKENDTFPFGLWNEAIKCCNEFGYKYKILNKEDFPINRDVKKQEFLDFINVFFKDYKFQPREYQIEAAWTVIKNRYCNISVATSGGKTFIFSMIYFFLINKYPDTKFLLVVPSKTLVTQFYDDILGFNYKNEANINIQEIYAEGEKPRIYNSDIEPNLVISTFQSLIYEEKIVDTSVKPRKKANGTMSKPKMKVTLKSKYPTEWFKQFWSVTVDEGHKTKSGSFTKKILKNTLRNATYRWGMSGTFPKDDTNEMMEIMAKTGPVLYTVKASELMEEGYITPVKIKCVHIKHNDYPFQELLEVVSMRDKKAMYDLEIAKIQERQERIELIKNIVNDSTKNTLVLFHNTEYGEKLFNYLKEQLPDKEFHYIDGSVKQKRTKKNIGKNRDDIKTSMVTESDKVQVLVASFGTLSTGVSIDSIANVIFTQSFKKEQVIIQSIGRALRLHKDKKIAYIFDLVDIFNYDEYSYRFKKKWENTLFVHGKKRKQIYDEETYPYKVIDVSLPEIHNDF